MITTKDKQKFCVQRWHAKKKGIDWNLTFDEWYQTWINSGLYHLRGKGKDKYCMCRKGDVGPYSVDNIYIATYSQNNQDQHKFKPTLIGIHNSKKCRTPLGEFPSRVAAAKAHGVGVHTIQRIIGKVIGYENA